MLDVLLEGDPVGEGDLDIVLVYDVDAEEVEEGEGEGDGLGEWLEDGEEDGLPVPLTLRVLLLVNDTVRDEVIVFVLVRLGDNATVGLGVPEQDRLTVDTWLSLPVQDAESAPVLDTSLV